MLESQRSKDLREPTERGTTTDDARISSASTPLNEIIDTIMDSINGKQHRATTSGNPSGEPPDELKAEAMHSNDQDIDENAATKKETSEDVDGRKQVKAEPETMIQGTPRTGAAKKQKQKYKSKARRLLDKTRYKRLFKGKGAAT